MNQNESRKLLLIDGNSLLFRAYFGTRYLSTSTGQPTNAIYGLAQMLLAVFEEEKPDAAVIAWDSKAPTFRHEISPQYKANRIAMADDLAAQVSLAHEMVEAMGIQSIALPGFEADDLLGSLARQGADDAYSVVILSGDTDMLQLVGEQVKVRLTRSGVSDTRDYLPSDVVERYGFPSPLVPDYKALVGDNSDNIAGVPGVGEKTASRWLQMYPGLEALIGHSNALQPERLRNSLIANLEQVRQSKVLATIRCDAPIDLTICCHAPTAENWQRTKEFFERLEFRTLLPRIPLLAAGVSDKETPSTMNKTNTVAATLEYATISTFSGLLQRLPLESGDKAGAAPVAIRLFNGSEKGVGLAAAGSSGVYRLDTVDWDELKSFFSLADNGILLRWAGYDQKTELLELANHGLPFPSLDFDAQIAAYVLNPSRSSYPIDDLAKEHLGEIVRMPAPNDASERAVYEAYLLYRLREPMRERLRSEGSLAVFETIEMPLIPILAQMELNGVALDTARLLSFHAELQSQIAEAEHKIYELAGERFNIGSTKQLQDILFNKLNLTPSRKTKTGFSTQAEFLDEIAEEHAIVPLILNWRELTKLRSTYVEALPKLVGKDGRVHTSFSQVTAATGRLSSNRPNLQNIPVRTELGRAVRRAFVAPKGYRLLSCDYSQIELRVFAHITQDPQLISAFSADDDVHTTTATILFGLPHSMITPEMRNRAKTTNFAVLYGQGDFGLSHSLGISQAEARAFIESYYERFPSVKQFTDETINSAREKGYVTTLLGRRRYLPELKSAQRQHRLFGERAAVNTPIQGSAADIMKLGMIKVDQWLKESGTPARILLQVHDELLLEVREDALVQVASDVLKGLETAYPLSVRLKAEAKAGTNWADMSRLL
ncbi:MAG: DNA polymerase I [Armatimonadetes bacterium]|nr:DNA polymerase I [Armatimonadota bacterium]